jgi:4-hydroxy-tetrahydrodipicolinate synthase
MRPPEEEPAPPPAAPGIGPPSTPGEREEGSPEHPPASPPGVPATGRPSPAGRATLDAMRPYEGLLTAMVTPFAADLSVNEEAAVALGRHLLAHGSHGLVVCGTTGEASTMTDEEQLSLIALIVEELGDGAPIVAGTGSNDTRHAVHLTEKAVEAGVDAVLSVTPYYNRPNRRGLLAHFKAVAEAAAGTPVVLYNIPSRTATNMPPDLLAELAQIDGIEAVKQANGDELQLIDGLAVLAGNDDNYLEVLELGGTGGICVASHVVGPEMRRMYDEPESRAEIDASLQEIYAAMFITASPAPVKAALRMLGHDVGGLRLPLVEADESELAVIRGAVGRHGLLSGVHAG